MPLVLANDGKPELLNLLLRDLAPINAYYNMFLFVNNYTPVANMNVADFTKPTWALYADHTLLRNAWNPAGFGTGKGQTTYGLAPESWVVGAPGDTVYGYGIQSLASGLMLWAERFAVPRIMPAGDTLFVQPQFTDDTDPNPL